jgi:hypothetical protein
VSIDRRGRALHLECGHAAEVLRLRSRRSSTLCHNT